MPEGSKIEKVYQALLDQGKSKESAARIAQAQTGQALATGRPPKHKNDCSPAFMDGRFTVGRSWDACYKRGGKLTLSEFAQRRRSADPVQPEEIRERASFQNGRARAEQEIANMSTNAPKSAPHGQKPSAPPPPPPKKRA